MMRHSVLTSFAAGAAALFLVAPAEAQLRLPSTFGSHMVLQQKTAVPFWGWASPSEEVKVVASWAKEPLVAKTSAPRGPVPHRRLVGGRECRQVELG